MKLTKKEIEEIKKLNEEGNTQKFIAAKLNISTFTVYYHLNKEKVLERNKERWEEKTPEEKKEIYKKNLPNIVRYQKRRYNNDDQFREQIKKRRKKEYAKKRVRKSGNEIKDQD